MRARLRLLLLAIQLALAAWAGTARTQGLADADTRLPVEVTADELVVERTRSLAIFRGEVEARQGSMILRADEVRVFYREDGAQDGQAVRRIEAKGHVRVSSPTETASGDTAVYDLEAGTVVMEGNVVLTRGDNVVQGERLVVDLRARTAQVEATRGRVRALFRPEELRPQGGKDAAAGGSPAGGRKDGGAKGGSAGTAGGRTPQPKPGQPAEGGAGQPAAPAATTGGRS